MVEVFVLDTQLRQALQEECLQYMPDFMYMSKKLLGGKATLQVMRYYSNESEMCYHVNMFSQLWSLYCWVIPLSNLN